MKELQDEYEKIVGVTPTYTEDIHEDPNKVSFSVDTNTHTINLKKGRNVKGINTEKTKDIVRSSALQRKLTDLSYRYTGNKNPATHIDPEDQSVSPSLEYDKTGTRFIGDKSKITGSDLEKMFKDKFHKGVELHIRGTFHKEHERRIYNALSFALSKLSPTELDKLKGLNIVAHHSDSPTIPRLIESVSKLFDKTSPEYESKMKVLSRKGNFFGIAIPKDKQIHLLRPEKRADGLLKLLSHEIHHVIEKPGLIIKPFAKKGLTPYANMYKSPSQKTKESMSDLFGMFNTYISNTQSKEKNPTKQIVGFIRKVFPGTTPKELRFKRYLIKKLHILRGLPLPHIKIKKAPQ